MMNQSKLIKQFFSWVILSLSIVLSCNAWAAEQNVWIGNTSNLNAPQQLVKDTLDKMLDTLSHHKEEFQKNPKRLMMIIEDILTPSCDFQKMSILALGHNWRVATPQQRDAFVPAFEKLLVRTYSTAVFRFTDQKLQFLPFRDDLSKGRVLVQMLVTQSSGQSVKVGLSLFKNKQNKWMFYDMKVDGISLVTNYRSTLDDKIRQHGMDKLIADIQKENNKVNQ